MIDCVVSSHFPKDLAAAWAISFAFDAMTFGLTVYKTVATAIEYRTAYWSRLGALLLRDGEQLHRSTTRLWLKLVASSGWGK